MKEPVTIIGAGPAGLAAAIVLARHGQKAKVYETAPDVGHRLHGDFQGLENWSTEADIKDLLHDMGIETNFFFSPYYESTVYAPALAPVIVKSERPLFYLVKRGPLPGTLDAGLKEQALSLGVEINFNHRVGTYDGPAIVATGPQKADAIGYGITFTTNMEDQAIVVLDDAIAPKGYAYLLVDKGHGTMVTILYREFRKETEYFTKTRRFFADTGRTDIKDEKRFGCYVNFFMRDSQLVRGKLYVGEAAGFQDCLWGFGMRYALSSGSLAAKSIIEGADYDSLWKKELRPLIETSLVNRFLFDKAGPAGYRWLTKKMAQGDPRALLQKHYNPSFPKSLLLPWAGRHHKNREKENNLSHEDCDCIWCRRKR